MFWLSTRLLCAIRQERGKKNNRTKSSGQKRLWSLCAFIGSVLNESQPGLAACGPVSGSVQCVGLRHPQSRHKLQLSCGSLGSHKKTSSSTRGTEEPAEQNEWAAFSHFWVSFRCANTQETQEKAVNLLVLWMYFTFLSKSSFDCFSCEILCELILLKLHLFFTVSMQIHTVLQTYKNLQSSLGTCIVYISQCFFFFSSFICALIPPTLGNWRRHRVVLGQSLR